MNTPTGLRPVWYVAASGHTVIVEYGPDGWTWRAMAGNGQPAALSPRAHTRKDAALRAARALHPERRTPGQ